MEYRTKVATEIEFTELRRLSTEKLIVWIIGKSKELGIKLTPEEVVLACWLGNPDKHWSVVKKWIKRSGIVQRTGRLALLMRRHINDFGLHRRMKNYRLGIQIRP